MRIGAHTYSGYFCVYLGTTCFCVFELFQNQTSGTFSHYESVTALAERTAGSLWVIVTGRQCVHCVETTYSAREDSSFGTS